MAWIGAILLVIYVIGIPIVAGACFQSMRKDSEDENDINQNKIGLDSALLASILVGCFWPFVLLMALGMWLFKK